MVVKDVLGLFDREASFSWPTNASKSFCLCSLPSRAFFCSSGLYLCRRCKQAARRVHVAKWMYLEDFLLCGCDIPDESWPTYAENCTSFETLVSCFWIIVRYYDIR